VDFTHYLNLVLQKREGQVELWQLVRNFSKWFFDLSCAISSWSEA